MSKKQINVGVHLCTRCYAYKSPYEPKEDIEEWQHFKLIDYSWHVWRSENLDEVEKIKQIVANMGEHAHEWQEDSTK